MASSIWQFQKLFFIGSCFALSASAAFSAYTVERVVGGLNQPTYMTQAPGDNTSIYIVERSDGGTLGKIRQYNLQTHTFSTFLDLSGTIVSDGGLLSMTFHPEYQSNGLFYIASNVSGTNALDEYRVVGGAPQLQRRLLEYHNLNNVFHTINQAHFRPNGNNNELFVTAGDGGTQADDPGFNKALIESPLSPYGKLMKIDLSQPFTAPAAGPGPGTGISLVALGLRNPFRSGFDLQTGDFYIGDVGFNTAEEIDYIPSSQFTNPSATTLDFGWTDREGTIATAAPYAGGPGSPGDINPIFDYSHFGQPLPHNSPFSGQSVTGGYVYRGPVSELQGRYFFSDFTNGNVYSGTFNTATPTASFNGTNLTGVTNHTTSFESLIGGGANIQYVTSFSEDNSGNLYIVKFGNSFFPPLGEGEIFKISPILSAAVTVQIDRATGAMTLTNATGSPISFSSLSISSAFGAIAPDSLIPITGHYDSTGNGSVDNNNPWSVTSPAGSHTLFSEATTGDAGTLAGGQQVSLSPSGGWIHSPTEDLFVSLLVDGNVTNATVTYTGNSGQPFKRSDLDFNNVVDAADWHAFHASAYANLTGLSRAEAYAQGDLDGDGDNDYADFKLFKKDYNAVNGAGAFEAMVAGTPEPAAASLAVVAAVFAGVFRQSKTRQTTPRPLFSNQEDN
jgi:hypothetical protein